MKTLRRMDGFWLFGLAAGAGESGCDTHGSSCLSLVFVLAALPFERMAGLIAFDFDSFPFYIAMYNISYG